MADSQVELVKQKTDIVSIIDSRVKLAKAGRNLKALCPFHGEKTPSFFVSPEMQTFRCFGCGRGGDAFTFLQEYEGMNFPESLEFLAQKAGVTLKRDYRTGEDEKRKRLLEILHLTQEYYHFLLTEHKVGRVALNYLKKRGITSQLIKVFNLGYAPESWDNLQKFLIAKKSYKGEELEAVGLIIRNQKSENRNQNVRYYDRFRGRVMFPLKDMRGKTLGFSGRLLESHAKEAKYINSPETILYHKSKMLYGLDVVRSQIKKMDRVVIVEGELDVVSSYKAGIKETVAIKGSALTSEQIELINRLTKNVVLALDADAAGMEATKRGIELADKAELNLTVVEIEGGKDPDDIAQQDPDAWREMIKKADSVYDFLTDRAFKLFDKNTGTGKKQISKELGMMLSKITNLVERDHYVAKVAKRLGVGKEVLEGEVEKLVRVGGIDSTPQDKEERVDMNRRERLERFLTGLFLQMKRGRKQVVEQVDPKIFSEPGLKSLWRMFIEGKVGSGSGSSFIYGLKSEQQRLVASLFTQEVVVFSNDEDDMVRAFERGIKELAEMAYREELTRLGELISEIENKEKLTDRDRQELKKWQNKYQEITSRMNRAVVD